MAARAAVGPDLKPDEFGGGDEAKGFLRKLGFEVVEKSKAPHPLAPKGVRAIRVDRAWMSLGVRAAAFREGGEPWAKHRKLVTDQFLADKAAYIARVRALARASGDARFVLLPACALVTGAGVGLDAYDLPEDRTVFAGTLDVDAGREAFVIRSASFMEQGDDSRVLAMDEGERGLMVAISSTIKQLHGDELPQQCRRSPLQPGKAVLVLDAGHHPYTSRYLFNTMPCSADGASRFAKAPAVVVLASWRYAGASFGKNWCSPEGRVTTVASLPLRDDLVDRLEIEVSR